MRTPPLVVMEGGSVAAFAGARAEVTADGWPVVEGWGHAGHGVVCAGRVANMEDAERAVLAVMAGAGLLVDATAAREVLDRLCDDLRRFGPLDHRIDGPSAAIPLAEYLNDQLWLAFSSGSRFGPWARVTNHKNAFPLLDERYQLLLAAS